VGFGQRNRGGGGYLKAAADDGEAEDVATTRAALRVLKAVKNTK
jgi:hypothetical protein